MTPEGMEEFEGLRVGDRMPEEEPVPRPIEGADSDPDRIGLVQRLPSVGPVGSLRQIIKEGQEPDPSQQRPDSQPKTGLSPQTRKRLVASALILFF